eukprot:scaffold187931_cov36-Tisochrysis_lutea.AAC.1
MKSLGANSNSNSQSQSQPPTTNQKQKPRSKMDYNIIILEECIRVEPFGRRGAEEGAAGKSRNARGAVGRSVIRIHFPPTST